MRRYLLLLLLGSSLSSTLTPLGAQALREAPVRIVIGYPPASSADVIVRLLASGMGTDLGRAVIVENRPGAGGTIAASTVARAPTDGHTLLVDGCSATAIVYAQVMIGKPALDPFADFTPVGRLMRDHWIVAASPALGVGSLAELVERARQAPTGLTYPTNGIGSGQHLQTERLRLAAGFDAVHVPYKDSPLPDLIAGRTSFLVQTSAAIAPLLRSGRLRGLAVLSESRMSALPDVPTIAEAGLPGLTYNAGLCLYAPGGTDPAVVARLNVALNAAGQGEGLRERFEELGVEPVVTSPAEAGAYIRELMGVVDDMRLRIFGKAR